MNTTQVLSPEPVETTAIGERQRPLVLCVDDDPEVTHALELRLREYDVDVLRAFHGMQAFWLAMTEQPDLIITDLKMPQGHGDYVVECLNRNSETCDIPVIVLTGTRDDGLKKRMIQQGVAAYFHKPCPFDELIAKTKDLVPLQRQAGA